jgi:DNA-binding NarL/FixJ family response regulator
MALVVSGLLNKQAGGELGISEITVKAHRRNVMRKIGVDQSCSANPWASVFPYG